MTNLPLPTCRINDRGKCACAMRQPVFHIESARINLMYFCLPSYPFAPQGTIRAPAHHPSTPFPIGASSFPSSSVQCPPFALNGDGNMSEERRSNSIEKGSGSDVNEKGIRQDIVNATTPSSPPLSDTPHRMPWPKRSKPLHRIFWRPPPTPRR